MNEYNELLSIHFKKIKPDIKPVQRIGGKLKDKT